MKKLCKNCGAKIPKKSDVCKKCGEPYEYIDLELDPETEKALQIEKPSNMLNICILLVSILVFIYSLVLIFLNFTNQRENSKNKLPQTSVSDSENSESNDNSSVHYNAIDFIGQPLSEVKKVLGDQYSIRISDTTLIEYINFPVILSTTDETPNDNSIISKVILKDNAQITPSVTANMTFDELRIVLALTQSAPELDEADAFYYVRKVFENDNYQMNGEFKFDNGATDKAPLEVILTCDELINPKVFGMVTGLDEDSWLNVRSQPIIDSEAIIQLYNGDRVEIISEISTEENNWFEVETSNGTVGFASAAFISKEGTGSAQTSEESDPENEAFEETDSENETEEETEETESDESEE